MKSYLKLNHYTIFMVVTLAALLLPFVASNFTGRFELLVQDLYFNLRGPVVPGDEVVIATIDEKSIDALGRWPWHRNVMADLVDRLTEYDAKVFGFDVVFSSPETMVGVAQLQQARQELVRRTGGADSAVVAALDQAIRAADTDQRFHDALKDSRRAVLGYFFHFSRQGLEHLSEAEMADYLRVVAKSRYSGIKKEPGASLHALNLRTAYAVETSIDKIASATKRAGYFNFYPEVDGSVRKVPLLVKYRDLVEMEGEDDYIFPPLSLSVLRKYLKSAILVWIDRSGVEKVALTGLRSFAVPTNLRGEMRINYYGPGNTFPHYSIVDILEKRIPPERLKGKMVLVGPTATAIEDLRVTPFDKVFPGVEVHATIIDNILHGRILADPFIPSLVIDIVSVLLVGLLLLWALLRLGPLLGGVVVLGTTAVILGGHYYCFSQRMIVLHSVPPLLELTFVSLALPVYRFVLQEREKRYIQGAFSQYLSPAVIEQIIENPSLLKLGGLRKEMTVFFSDVAGFSSVSEKLDSEALVKLLNEYLTAMTDIVLRHEGTIDKYEGDAIIAFFGAPMDEPEHARKCCRMALDMADKIHELQDKWESEGRPRLKVRMGINTGAMVVGNMGSDMRMDYTVMGDAVNLAARLEGANKEYGTSIMISEHTCAACRDHIEVRELDAIRVVGKEETVVVYELLGRRGGLTPERQQLLALYNEGLGLYRRREWRQAAELFAGILEKHPDDGPALTYMERCLDYQIRPPGKNWDGVYTLKIK